METWSVLAAAICQILGYSIFIEQPDDCCSPAPTLASWLFLFSILCFLWDTCVYPARFIHMSLHWQLIIEVVACIFLTEFGLLIVWCRLERLLYGLTHNLLYALSLANCEPWSFEYCVQGLSTTSVSGALFWFVLEATDLNYKAKILTCRLKESWQPVWNLLICFFRLDSRDRRRALRTCNLSLGRFTRCTKRRCTQLDCEEDVDEEEEDNDCRGDCDW
ncbi:CG34181 [Drosophila busckii]|uniref:CG34181 n=1 Tax=Drosophila busckii TaxID=30019 RepID=A0A0M4F087_DROBS|nr:uncharacterized protein LOC108599226 [Drosophila busckii]ALC44462.1 CG34181 [Drosophila busckii]